MKEKIKTKSFWVSVVAAIVLILQILGVKINVPYVNEIVESICALMILLGILTAPSPAKKIDSQEKNNSVEDKNDSVEDKNDNERVGQNIK